MHFIRQGADDDEQHSSASNARMLPSQCGDMPQDSIPDSEATPAVSAATYLHSSCSPLAPVDGIRGLSSPLSRAWKREDTGSGSRSPLLPEVLPRAFSIIVSLDCSTGVSAPEPLAGSFINCSAAPESL